MKQKISFITEAMSMQPRSFSVTRKTAKINPNFYQDYIKEIKLERLQKSFDGPEDYYVGYDFNGNVKFEYLAKSMNVEYYYESED